MKAKVSRSVVIVDIEGCSRCGEDHEGVSLTEIQNGQTQEEAYYLFCPKVTEPIVFGMEVAGNDNGAG